MKDMHMLTACAATVATAAPAAPIPNPYTSMISPAIFTMHAIVTNISGDRESPIPLKTALSRLYATMQRLPPPHMRI